MTLRPIAPALFAMILTASLPAAELRLGIIGLDTSHVTAFTKIINDTNDPKHVPGGRVVAAFKSFSPDIESSAGRVEEYTRALQEKFGVKIVPSVEALCAEVDAVLLENVDGRPHLELARPVFKAGKPMFIDKPLAGSLRDAIEIFRLAREHKVPVFTSSAYRFYNSMTDLKKTDIGSLRAAISYGPSPTEPHHPDLFWYGIHPTEALFTVLGTGCESVIRTSTPEHDVITGLWSGGRIGTLHAIKKGPAPHKVVLFGTKAVAEQKGSGDYAPLVAQIMKFFQTGVPPVSPDETLEIFAFMEAADESKRQGGARVSLRDVMKKHGAKGE